MAWVSTVILYFGSPLSQENTWTLLLYLWALGPYPKEEHRAVIRLCLKRLKRLGPPPSKSGDFFSAALTIFLRNGNIQGATVRLVVA